MTMTIADWKQLFTDNPTISEVNYKGTSLTKVIANGEVLWEKVNWVSKTGRIAELSTSSNDDWFTTSRVTFSKPIIPKSVYCYFNYDYYSYNDYVSTSCGGGFCYTCADGTTNDATDAVYINNGSPGGTGRPSSGKFERTNTLTDTQIEWFKKHGGIVECWYNAGGGTAHGTQSCGGYIQDYWEKQ